MGYLSVLTNAYEEEKIEVTAYLKVGWLWDRYSDPAFNDVDLYRFATSIR